MKAVKDIKKLTALLEGLSDPKKLLFAALPLSGSLFIDVYRNFHHKAKKWDTAIIIKELEEGETMEPSVPGLTFLDVAGLIPIGNIEILAEKIEWREKECIGLFLRTITQTS